MVGIYYELFYIYTIHVEEVDMNKRSNVSLIYRVYEAEIRWTLTCTLRKDQMKNLDYNEIKIFINLEIIGEEKLYLFFFNLKTFLQFLCVLMFFFFFFFLVLKILHVVI